MEDRHDDPVAITTAQVSRSEELKHRQQRYLVSMLIRTVCFILAVVVTGWARWFFILGALVLPYVAVVFANTARRKPTKQADVVHPEPIGAIEAGKESLPGETAEPGDRAGDSAGDRAGDSRHEAEQPAGERPDRGRPDPDDRTS